VGKALADGRSVSLAKSALQGSACSSPAPEEGEGRVPAAAWGRLKRCGRARRRARRASLWSEQSGVWRLAFKVGAVNNEHLVSG
jgi:hypothetical protein